MSYTIKEVSEMTNLSISTLRYYDKMGLLPGLKRKESGYRMFSEGDLEMLKIIDAFKKAGLRIKDMQHYLALAFKGESTLEERYQIFLKQETVLKEKNAELQAALEITRRKSPIMKPPAKREQKAFCRPRFACAPHKNNKERRHAPRNGRSCRRNAFFTIWPKPGWFRLFLSPAMVFTAAAAAAAAAPAGACNAAERPAAPAKQKKQKQIINRLQRKTPPLSNQQQEHPIDQKRSDPGNAALQNNKAHRFISGAELAFYRRYRGDTGRIEQGEN